MVKSNKQSQIQKGVKVEKEHAKSLKKICSKNLKGEAAAKEIAKDHVAEQPKYYDKLAKYVESVYSILAEAKVKPKKKKKGGTDKESTLDFIEKGAEEHRQKLRSAVTSGEWQKGGIHEPLRKSSATSATGKRIGEGEAAVGAIAQLSSTLDNLRSSFDNLKQDLKKGVPMEQAIRTLEGRIKAINMSYDKQIMRNTILGHVRQIGKLPFLKKVQSDLGINIPIRYLDPEKRNPVYPAHNLHRYAEMKAWDEFTKDPEVRRIVQRNPPVGALLNSEIFKAISWGSNRFREEVKDPLWEQGSPDFPSFGPDLRMDVKSVRPETEENLMGGKELRVNTPQKVAQQLRPPKPVREEK